jgi:23S rRNA (cytidine1920-2'-O)/16S rRNA (cytidine1409-2'-O)-methyltransferase
MAKTRLDILMVERGLATSRALAQRLVLAGQVRIDGQVALKPSVNIDPQASIAVDHGPPFVSRGGEKLAAALEAFGTQVEGRVCADAGASTGGFTDCLLQHGAQKVFAIDVGHGILEWKLRQDERVIVMERTNARYVEKLPEPISLATVDVSFISLKIMFPVIRGWFDHPPGGDLIALIKPQFEAGRSAVAHGGGVIRDPAIHRQVLEEVLGAAQEQGYVLHGLIRSPLLGPKGNTEFLAWLTYPADEPANLEAYIEHILEVV